MRTCVCICLCGRCAIGLFYFDDGRFSFFVLFFGQSFVPHAVYSELLALVSLCHTILMRTVVRARARIHFAIPFSSSFCYFDCVRLYKPFRFTVTIVFFITRLPSFIWPFDKRWQNGTERKYISSNCSRCCLSLFIRHTKSTLFHPSGIYFHCLLMINRLILLCSLNDIIKFWMSCRTHNKLCVCRQLCQV